MPAEPTSRRALPLSSLLWLGGALSLAASCDAFDADLLPDRHVMPSPDAGQLDSGNGGAVDGGNDGGGPTCPMHAESCNLVDDDCDGRTDEDTLAMCQDTILNATTRCVPVGDTASCVLLSCHEGFENCDGDPANGCEPYCSCHPCDDAGTEDGGVGPL